LAVLTNTQAWDGWTNIVGQEVDDLADDEERLVDEIGRSVSAQWP
jgi:hypothetical protein